MKKYLVTLMAAVVLIALCSCVSFAAEEAPRITGSNAHLKKISVTWDTRTQDKGYQIKFSTDKNFKSDNHFVKVDKKDKKFQTRTIKKLKVGKTYYFKVRGYDKAGKYSSYSEPVKVKTMTYDERADELLSSMTLKQKAAQMLLVNQPSKKAKKMASAYQYGGYTLFYPDIQGKNKSQLKKQIKGYQSVSKVKMFIATDEEGGTVVRISKNPKLRKYKFMSPRALYKKGGYKKVRTDTRKKSKFLKSLGINTNLAPVADVTYSSKDFIYKRTFSNKAKRVSKYIGIVIRQMNKSKEVSCVKHFPGYGNNGDTHGSAIKDRRKLSTFKNRDLLPFKTAIKNNCSMIMVNHNVVRCFDKKRPASISKKVHDYLRDTMGYDGIIITDSMGMVGVTSYGNSNGQRAVMAIKAGNDMLCTPYGKVSRDAIVKAVKSGKIKKSRIDQSVKRILLVKLKKGITE